MTDCCLTACATTHRRPKLASKRGDKIVKLAGRDVQVTFTITRTRSER